MTTTAGEVSFLGGGGEMGAAIRAHRWRETPLGPPAAWPQPLKTAVGILINSGYPMYVAWGPQFIQLYNDAYLPILGDKHPSALGRSSSETFEEIWEFIGPMFRSVLETGRASTFTDQLLPLNRRGFAEECYFVFSYSPILLEGGDVGGVFVAALETTDRVLRERRQKTLRELNAISPHGGRAAVLRAALEVVVADSEDAPALLVRAAAQDAAPEITLSAGAGEAALRKGLRRAARVRSRARGEATTPCEPFVAGPWPEPITRLARASIPMAGRAEGAGEIVLALSPRLAFDESYRDWLDAVGANIGALLAETEAFEMERQRAEALAEIDAAKTVFFSNVSHEFRTPLALMLAPLEDLLEAPDTARVGEHRQQVRVAHRNARRLLKLVNALLDFSRLEAGRVQATYEPVDLAAFTAELASNFRSATQAAGLELIVDCPPLGAPAFVDRDMWEKIVLNLVSNAFKFTLEGRIAVRVARVGDAAELTVEDTGAGIPEAELPRLFDRFHRVEATRGRSFEGTGIGLALVDELVKLHGGTIGVESRVEAGTRMTVRIPLGQAHLPADKVAAQGAAPAPRGERAQAFVEEAMRWLPDAATLGAGGIAGIETLVEGTGVERAGVGAAGIEAEAGARILLADDNADMRGYLASLLGSRGYAVEAVADGEAALAAAMRDPPALVLSDVMMPRLDGIGLLRALRALDATREIPTLLLSARAGEEARIEGLGAGADDYLLKPFSARELLARVSSAIRLAQARRETAMARKRESARILHLFDMAPGFMCVLEGPRHVWEFANQGYRDLLGRDDLVGRAVIEVAPEVEAQGYIGVLDTVFRTGERFVGKAVPLELGVGPARRRVLLDFIYEPVNDEAGRTTGIFVLGMDVTDRALAAERQQVLVNELNHRVKNTLATVQSIAWQSLRRSQNVEEARELIDERLISLAHAHDLLTLEHWTGASLADVVARALAPFSSGAVGRVAANGPDVRLSPGQTLALSLALHELATNAVKYGALSTRTGVVSLDWRRGEGGETRIVWRERGGPPVSAPKQRGFGSRLLQRTGADLGGAVDLRFEPNGVVCDIEIAPAEPDRVERRVEEPRQSQLTAGSDDP